MSQNRRRSAFEKRLLARIKRVRRAVRSARATPPPAAPPAPTPKPAPAAAPAPAPVPHWDRLAAAGHVSVGVGSYGYRLIRILDNPAPDGSWWGGRIDIGKYCSIAPCEIMPGGGHHPEYVTTWPGRTLLGLPGGRDDQTGRGDITIGNDVWLGRDSLIMSGVTIGHGAIVGSRAVVTRDVRPYAVVVGVPAVEVKRRFDDDTVERLLALAWWDWPEDKVHANIDRLCSVPSQSGLLDEEADPQSG